LIVTGSSNAVVTKKSIPGTSFLMLAPKALHVPGEPEQTDFATMRRLLQGNRWLLRGFVWISLSYWFSPSPDLPPGGTAHTSSQGRKLKQG